MTKRIAILGSTGSIGKNTLEVVDHLPEKFTVVSIAAKSNIDLLEIQAKKYRPKCIAVYDEDKALILKKRLPDFHVVGGMEGLKEAASIKDADCVVSAIVGSIGLVPTLAAIEAGKEIALANKEVLVAAGDLVTKLAKEKGVPILPVDSEHSAIFQCMLGGKKSEIRKLILTASGGPFRSHSLNDLKMIQVDDALKHPTWTMGAKVTTDCSTLMNKGLEVIEAYWLFGLPIDQISVVVHPQSVIHSMVDFVDGSILAQLGRTDMKLPIQYALTYPDRYPGTLKPFDFTEYETLNFYKPDLERFRCLKLAYEAIVEGGSMPCFMNAANETLVERFLNKEISWLNIGERLESLMSDHKSKAFPNLEEILDVEHEARSLALHA